MSECGSKALAEWNLLQELKIVNLLLSENCVIRNQHIFKFVRVITRSKHILDSIYYDVWESPEISIGRRKIFFLIHWIFKEFKGEVKLETKNKIKCLRIDNEGGYEDGQFLAFFTQ